MPYKRTKRTKAVTGRKTQHEIIKELVKKIRKRKMTPEEEQEQEINDIEGGLHGVQFPAPTRREICKNLNLPHSPLRHRKQQIR
jgi:hypothetical protein